MPTTTGTRGVPLDVAGFPSALHLDPKRLFSAFVNLEYGDGSPSHWSVGVGNSESGQTVTLDVDALASTPDQASRYCAVIAGPAAFFMKGATYTLVIAGEVSVPLPGSPGSVTFQPATFKPVSCPKPDGAPVDPFRANEPRTSDKAITRFLQFIDKYYNGLGASEADSWFAGYAYGGTGSKIAVNVHDATAALGSTRCDIVRPLGDWLLGPFAKQFTLQVRGTSRTGSTSWPAVNCPQ